MATNHAAWKADFNLPPPQCQGETAGPEGARADPRGWLPLSLVIGELVRPELRGSRTAAYPACPKGLKVSVQLKPFKGLSP